TLLFSATMPKPIAELAKAFLDDPVRIEVARSGKAADKVTQCVHFVGQGDKAELLRKCLAERDDDLSLVFSRTKHGAEKLMKRLVAWGFCANSIHGNKSQGQRERAIKAFKSGETRVLVATDVAARGIDIPGVSHVYNFDLPDVPENYVHRIGRTARAGREGEAVAFCSPAELHLLGNVEKLMGIDIDVASGERPEFAKPGKGRGNGRARSRAPEARGQRRGSQTRRRRPAEDRKFEDRV
ncbi:MAG: DEAD/DEAH box helicase, partial [Rhodobacteraceae bacterium]|nr:DEAD/DEAH box helicase [Paracoccaceae bacterium]